jgi:hypothetical protein
MVAHIGGIRDYRSQLPNLLLISVEKHLEEEIWLSPYCLFYYPCTLVIRKLEFIYDQKTLVVDTNHMLIGSEHDKGTESFGFQCQLYIILAVI